VPVADNGRQLLESFFDCVTTGPSGVLVGGNTCMEGQCAGNGPKYTHADRHMYRSGSGSVVPLSNDTKKTQLWIR